MHWLEERGLTAGHLLQEEEDLALDLGHALDGLDISAILIAEAAEDHQVQKDDQDILSAPAWLFFCFFSWFSLSNAYLTIYLTRYRVPKAHRDTAILNGARAVVVCQARREREEKRLLQQFLSVTSPYCVVIVFTGMHWPCWCSWTNWCSWSTWWQWCFWNEGTSRRAWSWCEFVVLYTVFIIMC